MDRSLIKTLMPSLVAGHVPRNVRSIKYRVFDDQPQPSALGFAFDPQPFDGKVVAATDDAIVVKLKPSEFAVLDPNLVTAVPSEGAKVHVQPYARHRFDGLRADTPEVITEKTSDGTPYTITRHILGSAPAKLPIPEPQCMELGQLIEQLEEMPAPDGFRRITHMLVDAGARDFTWVDPKPSKIIETPPSISFTVSTAKFEGRVTVLYDRAGDAYVVERHRNHGELFELVDRHDEVYFDMLGEVLERLIDDGRWRLIDVSVIDAKAARRRQAVLT
ncbi:GTPase [Diaphorobacter sp. JS3050]|uniref:GTPase n=1 Tax=Diaphorobacter sp. JS3050 TaxID=2735554 RepID=UPI001555E210|nr:GTPase [Diaphorobacter sp. JS3050]QJY31896.1 GTPase [Diaphorobacter sp. JS3050]